jgi:hypothetical protein
VIRRNLYSADCGYINPDPFSKKLRV